MTVGVPGCGKSTYAKEWLKKSPATRARVNRDDIRAMIGDQSQWQHPDFEKIVTDVQRKILWEHLKSEKDVIIDNTNVNFKNFVHMEILLQDFANQFNKPVELSNIIFDVDYDECVRRNNLRDRVVPIEAVSRIYDSFKKLMKNFGPYKNPMIIHPRYNHHTNTNHLPAAIIVDLDGTIADLSHRDPYDAMKCVDDGFYADVWQTIDAVAIANDARVILVSGREETAEAPTRMWCELNDLLFEELHMRRSGDNRPDRIIKTEIYNDKIKDRYHVICAFDDRDQAVRAWRTLGIRCYQVAYGDF
jgi:predicted kinase